MIKRAFVHKKWNVFLRHNTFWSINETLLVTKHMTYSPPHYVLKLLFLGDYINFIFLETLYHQEIIWIWFHLLSWHLAHFPSGIQHGIYIEYSKWLESRFMPLFRLIGAHGITWKCYIIYLKSNWPL